MTYALPAVGDLVLSDGRVVKVARVGKLHRAEGIWVPCLNDFGEWSPYLRFQQDWTIKRAGLGVTVCQIPQYSGCRCGLQHVPAEDLAYLGISPAPGPAPGIATVHTILEEERGEPS